MIACPACGSARVYASRLRSLGERLRQFVTGRHPHRCHACGWRDWLARTAPRAPQDQESPWPSRLTPARAVTPADLDRLDPTAPPDDTATN